MNTCLHSCATTVSGTEVKFSVSLMLPGTLVMDDIDFVCTFYIYTDKAKAFAKGDMTRVSDNNYTVVVDTSGMGAGAIKYVIEAVLPDGRK